MLLVRCLWFVCLAVKSSLFFALAEISRQSSEFPPSCFSATLVVTTTCPASHTVPDRGTMGNGVLAVSEELVDFPSPTSSLGKVMFNSELLPVISEGLFIAFSGVRVTLLSCPLLFDVLFLFFLLRVGWRPMAGLALPAAFSSLLPRGLPVLQEATSATVKPHSLACISVALQHFSGASTASCAGSCFSDWPLGLGHALPAGLHSP